VSVIGLRARYNEGGRFLISTIPALKELPLSAAALFVPHFVDAAGYTTQFILLNAGASRADGCVTFVPDFHRPLTLTPQ
jgi:hypothetical protein